MGSLAEDDYQRSGVVPRRTECWLSWRVRWLEQGYLRLHLQDHDRLLEEPVVRDNRWKQTGETGIVPNNFGWENIFMAVAIDDDIDLHPKNKRLPASRLGWAAANLVYGQEDKPLGAPLWSSIYNANDGH